MDEIETDDEHPGFWIRTEPTIDGKAYVATLSLGDDHALTLTPVRARAYAEALLAAAGDAEYDHAVYRQVTEKLGLGERHGVQLVLDMRQERPQREACGIVFQGEVGQKSGLPYVRYVKDGVDIGQLTVPACRRHALAVMEARSIADLDATYYKILRSLVGSSEETARQVVDDVGSHRQKWAVADE